MPQTFISPSDRKWFLTKVLQAIRRYRMIESDEHVALALSGGKDSMVLLYILAELRTYSFLRFRLSAIHVDSGWDESWRTLMQCCQSLEIPLHVEHTDIARIVFTERREKNPCSLCAKLRRGALVNVAQQLGCQKLALAHSGDDAIDTFFLNIVHGGNLRTLEPRTDLEDKNLALIRPLVYLQEKTVRAIVKRKNLPVLSNPCPVNGKTQRQQMKELFDLLEERVPDIREKFIQAVIPQK